MDIWLKIPFFVFSGMAVLKYLERALIVKQPKVEKKILFVQGKYSLWKVTGFSILTGVIFFTIQPDVMTVGMAFFKLSLVCSIFFLDSMMKPKLYITDKRMYVVERFQNKRFVHIKELNTENVYNVKASMDHYGVYYLYYYGDDNQENQMELHIPKQEERDVFKSIMKQRMNINILRELEHEHEHVPSNSTGIDRFSKGFIWLAFITMIVAIRYAFKAQHTMLNEAETVVSYAMTSLFIPLSLYFFSYFFMLTSGMMKKMKVISVKMVAFHLLIASSTVPFYYLIQKGAQTKDEFIKNQLNGVFVFALIILASVVLGIVFKTWSERKITQQKNIRQRV